MHSIIEDQTKPASEWIAGRIVQKVSPTGLHAQAQARMVSALLAWADRTGSGRVGTEWEFRITPPGAQTRTLVPDISFLSFERAPYDDAAAEHIPYLAPDIAIEVRSPNDRRRNVKEKIRVYLSSGTKAVFEVDPKGQIVTLYDAGGVTVLAVNDTLTHPALPGFSMPVAGIFAKTKPRA